MKLSATVWILAIPALVACGQTAREPAKVPAPTADEAPQADGSEAEAVAPAPEPARKEPTACTYAATDFIDIVCGEAFECETMVLDVGCVPRSDSEDTLICTCNYDYEDRTTFEMPRSGCDELDAEFLADRCSFPFEIVLEG